MNRRSFLQGLLATSAAVAVPPITKAAGEVAISNADTFTVPESGMYEIIVQSTPTSPVDAFKYLTYTVDKGAMGGDWSTIDGQVLERGDWVGVGAPTSPFVNGDLLAQDLEGNLKKAEPGDDIVGVYGVKVDQVWIDDDV